MSLFFLVLVFMITKVVGFTRFYFVHVCDHANVTSTECYVTELVSAFAHARRKSTGINGQGAV